MGGYVSSIDGDFENNDFVNDIDSELRFRTHIEHS